MPTTFMSKKNGILGLSEPEKAKFLEIIILIGFKIPCSAELSMKKVL